MDNGLSVMEIMRRRKSVRSYDSQEVGEEVYRSMAEFISDSSNMQGILGHMIRVETIQVSGAISDKGIRLGTYGMIRNPRGYLVGIIPDGNHRALLDFGYVFEKLVLHLTAQGIGTCWLGGTFTRSSFEREVVLHPGESIPCITPFGYPKAKEGVLYSALRYAVKADLKKGWDELFRDGDFATPLLRESAADLAEPVEMVRLGPSASNKQPWRLVVSPDRRSVHFYLAHTPRYSDTMQRIDMGIAICHFATACAELGLQGEWVQQEPAIPLPDERTEYIISWQRRQ